MSYLATKRAYVLWNPTLSDAESGEALGQECGVGVDDIPQQKLGTHAEDLRRADGMRAILRSKCSHNGTFRQGRLSSEWNV